jgi:SAM-dependent methyltransferase
MSMSPERVYPLDADILELFASKGTQGGCGTVQIGNANGVKVRRVMQITSDFARAPFDQLKIVDFGCGEGVYAIEAALRGAEVVALDARTQRMNEGARAAERLGLTNLRFEQTDIRNVNVDSHGMADVIFFLGILYHLDYNDVSRVLHNIYEMCRKFVIIDTHIALHGHLSVQHHGQGYLGLHVREHADTDTEEVRKDRLGASLDTFSFLFTKESLFRLLNDVGFTSVCECMVPLEPDKPEDRITIVASKGERVKLSSYPWVNDRTEDEVTQFLNDLAPTPLPPDQVSRLGLKQLTKSLVNRTLKTVGLEIRRI